MQYWCSIGLEWLTKQCCPPEAVVACACWTRLNSRTQLSAKCIFMTSRGPQQEELLTNSYEHTAYGLSRALNHCQKEQCSATNWGGCGYFMVLAVLSGSQQPIALARTAQTHCALEGLLCGMPQVVRQQPASSWRSLAGPKVATDSKLWAAFTQTLHSLFPYIEVRACDSC